MPLWREANFQVKMYKALLGPLLDAQMSKKVRAVGARNTLEVKMQTTPHIRTTFGHSDVVLCDWQASGQAGRQIDRQTGRHIDREIERYINR